MKIKNLRDKLLNRQRFNLAHLLIFLIVFGAIGSIILIVSRASTTGDIQPWQVNPNPLPAARYGQTSVIANGYVYAIAGRDVTGNDQSTVYYAKINNDGTTGSWNTNSYPIPDLRINQGTVTANGYIYVIGGMDNSSSVKNSVFYAQLNSDGSTGPWITSSNSLPAIRYSQMTVTANGYIYVNGGYDGSTVTSTVFYTKLNADGSNGVWQTNTAGLPAARTSGTSVVINGYIYVIGGDDAALVPQTSTYYAKLNADGSTGAWTTSQNSLPAGRIVAGSAVVNGNIYLIGGNDGTNCLSSTVFANVNSDGSIGNWNTSAISLPIGLREVSSPVYNGHLLAIGGRDNAQNAYSTVYHTSVSSLQVGPADIQPWQLDANGLPSSLYGDAAVANNGYVYALGGATSGTGTALDSVYYTKQNDDGSTEAWTKSFNPLPTAVENPASVVYGGYIYAIGGYNSGGSSIANVYFAKLNTDGSVGAWTSTTDMPQPRYAHSSAVANGYVYVIGGSYSFNQQQNSVYYAKLNADGSVGAWQISSNVLPTPQDYQSTVINNGYVYSIGGRTTGSSTTSTVYYAKLNSDGSTGAWSATNNLPAARFGQATALLNGYVYVIGGSDGNVAQSTVYYAKLNPDGTTGVWYTSANPLPDPRYEVPAAVLNGYIYAVGGAAGFYNPQSTVYYTSTNSDVNDLTLPPRTISFDLDDDVVVPFIDNPVRGLIWSGIRTSTGACADDYELYDDQGNLQACTHGPDPTESQLDTAQTLSNTTTGTTSTGGITCDGDGSSGYRVQMLYTHAADVSDRYSQFSTKFQQYAAKINNIMRKSSNGRRSIRFVTDSNCKISVPDITLSATGDNNSANTEKELKAKGYNQPNRKYVIWSDAKVYCGIADVALDAQPGQANASNGSKPEYARIDTPCWGGASEAHELMHTLGAVQNSAPHSSGANHCNDGLDVMCYNDHGPTSSYTSKSCPNELNKNIYDCNKNDYFNANPSIAATNYLATHWNAANSRFLIGSPAGNVTPPTNLTVSAVSVPEIDLAWTPPIDAAVAGYYITRNGVQIAQIDASATTYSDTNLNPANSYSYIVTAYNSTAETSDASNIATGVTNNGGLADTTPPATPNSLFASVVSANQASLYLPPSTDNIAVTSYDIYRDNVNIATIASSISDPDSAYLSYDDVTTLPKTTYNYWVVARDAAGNQSGISNKVTVTTPSSSIGSGSITGRVTDIYNAPLPAVKISYTINGAKRSVSTNSNGNYVISLLPAGKLSLSLSISGYSPRSITKTVLINDNTIADINLRRLAMISGKLTDAATGAALSSVTVSYQLNGSKKSLKTNSAGQYTIVNLPAGTYNLNYSLSHYQSQTKTIQVKLDQSFTQDVSLVH